ncbi:MAG: hypothetical protein H7122_03980 [Chitinophagaceae bacterium]|nr:hypothetical protein [Chitinophagaceae bacterium]
MFQFLQTIIEFLHGEGISYMLSGSVAMSVYTIPRSTRNIDFVINLQAKDAEKLASYFKEGYYCDKDAVTDAIEHQTMFNIIDHATGFKADFVILKTEAFRQKEFERRIKADFFGIPIYVVTVEDLLLSKLIWIQEMQSSIQKEDIKNLILVEEMDWHYIRYWINSLRLNTFNLL